MSFKIPAFDAKNEDSAALDLLASLLFDETSPLYQELVIRDQKVEELSVYAPFRRDPGLFMVFAKVKDPSSSTRFGSASTRRRRPRPKPRSTRSV